MATAAAATTATGTLKDDLSQLLILFLDIDGVLLPFPSQGNTQSTCIFPDRTLSALSHILTSLGDSCRIVLTSTWRVNFEQGILDNFHAYAKLKGGPLANLLHFYDRTDPTMHTERQHEIYAWMAQQQQSPKAWVALDDEDLLNGRVNERVRHVFQGHFCQTVSNEGLTMERAENTLSLFQAQLNA
jgi:hypothetical protein